MRINKNRISFLFKCFTIILTFFIVSCSKDSYDNLSDDNSTIYNKVLTDSLFDNLDKAYYEYKINAMKYGGTDIIDAKLAENLKSDIKNKKVKSYAELVARMEAIGYKDYDARSKVRINLVKTKLALFKKYPELNQNLTEFNLFRVKNSKHQVSHDTIKKLISNKNVRNYVKK